MSLLWAFILMNAHAFERCSKQFIEDKSAYLLASGAVPRADLIARMKTECPGWKTTDYEAGVDRALEASCLKAGKETRQHCKKR